MTTCDCGSAQPYESCCEPLISGEKPAATAEALMRSRYSAYARGAMDHLRESLHPDHRADYDEEGARRWAQTSEWLGLRIVATEAGGENDDEGLVEFIAEYRRKGEKFAHHEIARFQDRKSVV